MATGPYGDGGLDPRDSIGQPDSMRNEEQRLRDNQGGSELTSRPDDHPAGAPGETASAEAAGPPPNLADAGSHLSDADYQRNPAEAGSTSGPGSDMSGSESRARRDDFAHSPVEAASQSNAYAHEATEAASHPPEGAGEGEDGTGNDVKRGDNANIGAPVRSAGPSETTLPEESPFRRAFQPGGPSADEIVPPPKGKREK